MEPSAPPPPAAGQRILRWLVKVLLALLLIWPLTLGTVYLVNEAYTTLDPTRFPLSSSRVPRLLETLPAEAAEPQKGAVLALALVSRLEEELDSRLGWSVNDLWLSPTRWLDNRANRQRGVIFSTRMLINFFATHLGKYGTVDAENEWLKEAREKRFAFTEDSWWLPSSESEYRKGIELVRRYANGLKEGKSVYNVRTDDVYNLLVYILGPQFLDQPLGLLVQPTEQVPYSELDDRIYYTQGVVLVLRDFLYAFAHLYPWIGEKGGGENLKIAFQEMERICTFDPLVVLRGRHDSIMADHRGKMASYLISVRERLNDIAQSIRR